MKKVSPKSTPILDFSTLPAYLASVAGWLDAALPRFLPSGDPGPFLYDLARDYPGRGGKRFRPALLLLCNALAGGEPARALPSAVAIELFQNFALVHDDIEDDSQLRRGSPALHRLHGIPLALNAGDLLFALVYEALQQNGALLGARAAGRVQRRFAELFRRTFEGQALDIGWCRAGYFPNREEYERMIRLKTGWYSGRGPCQIGALIGGAKPALLEALGSFGELLGIGFQVQDDLLNLTADSAGSGPRGTGGGYGKERGGDIAEGKRTLIVIEMLERLAPAEIERLNAALLAPPAQTDAREIAWVIERAQACGAVGAVRQHCRRLGEQAHGALRQLPPSPQRDLLGQLADFLVEQRRA